MDKLILIWIIIHTIWINSFLTICMTFSERFCERFRSFMTFLGLELLTLA